MLWIIEDPLSAVNVFHAIVVEIHMYLTGPLTAQLVNK